MFLWTRIVAIQPLLDFTGVQTHVKRQISTSSASVVTRGGNVAHYTTSTGASSMTAHCVGRETPCMDSELCPTPAISSADRSMTPDEITSTISGLESIVSAILPTVNTMSLSSARTAQPCSPLIPTESLDQQTTSFNPVKGVCVQAVDPSSDVSASMMVIPFAFTTISLTMPTLFNNVPLETTNIAIASPPTSTSSKASTSPSSPSTNPTLMTITLPSSPSPSKITASISSITCTTTTIPPPIPNLSTLSSIPTPIPTTVSVCTIQACHSTDCYLSETTGPTDQSLDILTTSISSTPDESDTVVATVRSTVNSFTLSTTTTDVTLTVTTTASSTATTPGSAPMGYTITESASIIPPTLPTIQLTTPSSTVGDTSYFPLNSSSTAGIGSIVSSYPLFTSMSTNLDTGTSTGTSMTSTDAAMATCSLSSTVTVAVTVTITSCCPATYNSRSSLPLSVQSSSTVLDGGYTVDGNVVSTLPTTLKTLMSYARGV